jgi:hypothetical protein
MSELEQTEQPHRFVNQDLRRDYERRRLLLFIGIIMGNLAVVSFILMPLNRLGILDNHYLPWGVIFASSTLWGIWKWRQWNPDSEDLNEPPSAPVES